jgi:hypothetical protein
VDAHHPSPGVIARVAFRYWLRREIKTLEMEKYVALKIAKGEHWCIIILIQVRIIHALTSLDTRKRLSPRGDLST